MPRHSHVEDGKHNQIVRSMSVSVDTFCSCRDQIDRLEFIKDKRFSDDESFRGEAFLLDHAFDSGYCYDCYCEIVLGATPLVPNTIAPRGTGLTYRQRCGQRRT